MPRSGEQPLHPSAPDRARASAPALPRPSPPPLAALLGALRHPRCSAGRNREQGLVGPGRGSRSARPYSGHPVLLSASSRRAPSPARLRSGATAPQLRLRARIASPAWATPSRPVAGRYAPILCDAGAERKETARTAAPTRSRSLPSLLVWMLGCNRKRRTQHRSGQIPGVELHAKQRVDDGLHYGSLSPCRMLAGGAAAGRRTAPHALLSVRCPSVRNLGRVLKGVRL